MKEINLMLFFGLISVLTFAQKNETNLIVSPAMTFGNISESQNEINPAFGISFAIQELYNITEKFAIGTELNYSTNNYKLRNGLYTGDWTSYYESILNIQSLSIPFILRYKTKKEWIFQAEYGLSYALDSKLKVTSVSINHMNDNAKEQTPIDQKSNDIKGDLNSNFSVAFGKGFTIKQYDAMIQIYFDQILDEYHFSHSIGNSNNEYMMEYTVNPHLMGLRLGIKL